MKRKKTKPIKKLKSRPVDKLIRLWVLRILVRLGGHKEFLEHGRIHYSEGLRDAMGLAGLWDGEFDGFDGKSLLQNLRKQLVKAEKERLERAIPAALSENSRRLADLVGLSATDQRILEFVALLKSESLLVAASECLGELNTAGVIRAVTGILDLDATTVRTSLSGHGPLVRSGLLNLSEGELTDLHHKLDLLSDSFAERLLLSNEDPVLLLNDVLAPCPDPGLGWDDYRHFGDTLELLKVYFRQALDEGKPGVNALLYGIPGTGKTQLARLIAKELACELFEVSSEDNEGDPVTGTQRWRAFRVAQSFLANRRALLLLDEAEDVFFSGDDTWPVSNRRGKAWINHTLEANPVPAFWLSNSASCLDPAFVRRFDIVMAMPVPPKKQREQIVAKFCGDIVTKEALARLASANNLAPAVVGRAAAVVLSAREGLPGMNHSDLVESLVNQTLTAQGLAPVLRGEASKLPDHYDLRYINADVDLGQVAQGLLQTGAGRLCLYGPPGTGKTAFGRWLADELDAPLHVRRGSDLFDKYVGESEKNIARAFREAEREKAVLLIDEVDGFLRERSRAFRTFEVTGVNEMLTQMEAFDGVFIASTNLMDDLDQASLRRFDLKIHFGYLRPEQAWDLFLSRCHELGLEEPGRGLRTELNSLVNLTPGDYAVSVRQHRFRPVDSPKALLSVLRRECERKGAGAAFKTIGFVNHQ